MYNVTVENDTQYLKERLFFKINEGIDFRAKNLEFFDSLEKLADFYATVRSLYLQDRERK